jgi:hypothetical protein
MSAAPATLIHVSTKDQILSAELRGEALLTAKRPELRPLIDHLREVARGPRRHTYGMRRSHCR